MLEVNILYAVFLSSLSLLVITINLAVIWVFSVEQSLREKPSDLLILNLSIIELIQGFTLLMFPAHQFVLGAWKYGKIGCKLYAFFGDSTAFGSLMILVALSTDRLLLVWVEYPKYLKIQSRQNIHIIILICWICSMIPMAIEIGLWEHAMDYPVVGHIYYEYECLSPMRRLEIISLIFFAFFILSPVLLVTSFSAAFLCLLQRRLVKSYRKTPYSVKTNEMTPRSAQISVEVEKGSETSVSTNPSTSTSNLTKSPISGTLQKRYIRPAVTLGALVLAMLICFLPYCCYVIISAFCPFCTRGADPTILHSLLILQHFNAFMGPLFYAMTQRKIKAYFKKKLQCI